MKTLTHVDGDLLKHKTIQAIGHQANCQNTFGSGIARSIKEMYPEAYLADTLCDLSEVDRLGNFTMAHVPINGTVNRYNNHISRIFNLYGQNLGTNYTKRDRKTNYEALYSALEKMAGVLTEYDGDHRPAVVGFPFLMGSALGGGNWKIVERLIEVAFDGYESDVFIVHFNV